MKFGDVIAVTKDSDMIRVIAPYYGFVNMVYLIANRQCFEEEKYLLGMDVDVIRVVNGIMEVHLK